MRVDDDDDEVTMQSLPILTSTKSVPYSIHNHNNNNSIHISGEESFHYPKHHRPLVTVLQRSAKDFTEDWRKDITCSVAHLRSIFNRPIMRTTSETLNSRSVRPVSVMIGNENIKSHNNNNYFKERTTSLDNSVHYISTNNSMLNRDKMKKHSNESLKENACITVVHVTQNGIYGKPSMIVRSASLPSSEDESYV